MRNVGIYIHLNNIQGHYSQDAQAIVDNHYEATYRQVSQPESPMAPIFLSGHVNEQVDQQMEGAHQLVAQRAMSPQRPYPVRPKNRVSIGLF